jgi:hypothetical protein
MDASLARSQHEAGSKQTVLCLIHVDFLVEILYDSEAEDDVFFRDVS